MADRGSSAGSNLENKGKSKHVRRVGPEEEDELSMVFSDVLKHPRPKVQRTLPSMFSSQRALSTTRVDKPIAPPAAVSPQPSPRMQLAVHIRSSSAVPFTPIKGTNSNGSFALGLSPRQAGAPTTPSHTSARLSTPNDLTRSAAVAETGMSSLGVKKRGRPKGWKRGSPYTTDPDSRYRKREARALETAESQVQRKYKTSKESAGESGGQPQQGPYQNHEAKRRGRPPRPMPLSSREQYLQSKPEYIPYKCEWATSRGTPQQEPSLCPAELQNMDTLRRHVLLVHGDMDPLVCRFPRCRDRDPPIYFKTEEEFADHMEKTHFAVYLWYLGEGYQNNGIRPPKDSPSSKPPAYLCDAHGNQVTPSIGEQKLETDLQYKERRRRLKILRNRQNENAPLEEEWMQQMLGIEQSADPESTAYESR